MGEIDRQKIELGRKGEEIALKYLTDKGYELIARNYRFKRFGELDLIMKDGKYLVFVEVRTKKNTNFGTPLETVDYTKRRQISKMAQLYFVKEKIPEDTFSRFDVIGIVLPDNAEPKIEHIQDAFIIGD
ncbi:MAG: YraN family protein [Candidatus Riflebacteria bacterium]|jgi:putative endonuclease|nr:YraN family protein [Candidatus Riflebacteria bacterium]